tara:strand:+ start:29080 stop:29502 length:423 start_codon:yes stop_codon:yes gene_type:complete
MSKKITCGILIETNDNKFLIGHSTNNEHYDIPKGQQEEGETYIETAIRETEEEFNLCFKEKDLKFLDYKKLNKKKNLALFYTKLKEEVKIEDLTCNTFVNEDLSFPEIDYYVIVDKKEMLEKVSKSLKEYLLNNNIFDRI